MSTTITHEELAAQKLLDQLSPPKREALRLYALRSNKPLTEVIGEALDLKATTIISARTTASATTVIGSLG